MLADTAFETLTDPPVHPVEHLMDYTHQPPSTCQAAGRSVSPERRDPTYIIHAIRPVTFWPFERSVRSRRARAVSKGGANSEFQSVLFEQPYCRITNVMDRCNVSRPTATSWLTALADNGMLQNVKTGRDRLFINREFLQLLVRRG
jgi:hypothetical protein